MFSRLLPVAGLFLCLANLAIGNQVFETIENKIGQKFAAVKVDRAKLGIAVGALGRRDAYDFKNNLVHDQLSGVKRENLEGVANFVCLKLGLKDHTGHCTKVKTAFQMMGLSDKSEAKLDEISFQIGFQSLFGFISGVKNSQGDVDIGYTIHHHEFKVPHCVTTPSPPPTLPALHLPTLPASTTTRSTRPSMTTRSTRPSTTTRSNIPSTTTRYYTRSTTGHYSGSLTRCRPSTIEEVHAIKWHYSKYEALRTMKQENVIKSISYV